VVPEHEDALRKKAKDLFSGAKVKLIVGYETSPSGSVRPFLARSGEDASRLVWSPACVHNLAAYLTREPVASVLRRGETVGIVVKGCDARAVVTLIQEEQVPRDRVHVIGMVCDGVRDAEGADLAMKCRGCDVRIPLFYDELIGDPSGKEPLPGNPMEDVEKLLGKSEEERWTFWKEQMDRCIRCYACREVCPMCYCKECITERSRPQWIDRAPHSRGNLIYHVVRAAHLAGRCASCGECSRVCPMGIPVDMLNRFLTSRIREAFGHECGVSCDAELFQSSFGRDTDPEDFIR
jgi:formate dehydrogenase subunit beta